MTERTPGQTAAAATAEQHGGEAGQLTIRWEILDDERTPRQLINEGRRRLAVFADEHEITVLADHWDVHGLELRLVADVVFWPPRDWDGLPILAEDPEPKAA